MYLHPCCAWREKKKQLSGHRMNRLNQVFSTLSPSRTVACFMHTQLGKMLTHQHSCALKWPQFMYRFSPKFFLPLVQRASSVVVHSDWKWNENSVTSHLRVFSLSLYWSPWLLFDDDSAPFFIFALFCSPFFFFFSLHSINVHLSFNRDEWREIVLSACKDKKKHLTRSQRERERELCKMW